MTERVSQATTRPDTEPSSNGDTPSSKVTRRPPGLVPVTSDSLPPVNYRPLVLRDWMLAVCLVFHLICIALVAFALYKSSWYAGSLWIYALLVILPYILGTTSAVWVDSIIGNLSRITPFLLCASDNGALASRSIFQQCFPVPSMREAGLSHCWFLVVSHVIWWLTIFLVPLKASLLVTDQDELQFWITDWAAYTLLVIHALVSLYIIGVIIHLSGRNTGLRDDWDVVTMADHMALFRHSNFLKLFDGTGGAERDSMMGAGEASLSKLQIKLGYWKLAGQLPGTDRLWYGFGMVTGDEKGSTDGALTHPQHSDDGSLEFSKKKLDEISKNSVFAFLDIWSFAFQFTFWLAVLLAGGYIFALVMSLTRNGASAGSNSFIVPIGTDWASVVFVLIPVTLLGMFRAFWSDAALFAAITQPFVGMRDSKGRPAQDTILLNYVCLSSAEQVMTAAKKEHWKVALTGAAKSLHRLLPNLAGPSIMIGWDSAQPEVSIISLNFPLVAIVSLWLVLELFLMPWVALTGVDTRSLPRDYLCIADLLSWICTSKVLTAQDSDDLDQNPLHVPVSKGRGQKEDMEARLRLSKKHYRFGVVPAEGRPGKYMIGIGFVDSEEPANEEQPLLLLGAKGFVMVGGVEGTVAGNVAANGIQAQPGGEEEDGDTASS